MSNNRTISPDDPRLTAYALNEMEPGERTEFEQRLRGDPAARAIVDDIIATSAEIRRTLAQEELPVTAAPWNPSHRLVRIGLKAREVAGGSPVIAPGDGVEVEFNPAQVAAYRLIGWENPAAAGMDDGSGPIRAAGGPGPGGAVTALYALIPAPADREASGGNLLVVKIRHQAPGAARDSILAFPLSDGGAAFAQASADFKFAAAVAAFGMILRDSPHKGTATLADVAAWVAAGTGRDAGGHRGEFLGLVEMAGALQ